MAPRPTPKLEDHTFSPVRDYLLNIFAANLRTGDHFSIRNLKKPHAIDKDPFIMASQLIRPWIYQFVEKYFEFPLRLSSVSFPY